VNALIIFFFVKVVLFSFFINSFWVRLVFLQSRWQSSWNLAILCTFTESDHFMHIHWIWPFYAHSLNLTCFYGSTFTKESWLIADHQNLILVRYLKYLKIFYAYAYYYTHFYNSKWFSFWHERYFWYNCLISNTNWVHSCKSRVSFFFGHITIKIKSTNERTNKWTNERTNERRVRISPSNAETRIYLSRLHASAS